MSLGSASVRDGVGSGSGSGLNGVSNGVTYDAGIKQDAGYAVTSNGKGGITKTQLSTADKWNIGLGVAGGALNTGLAIADAVQQNKYNKASEQLALANLQNQKDSFEYQKKLNELQMNREDTAVQRRMKDLQAAGINPLLALNGEGTADTGSYSSASMSPVSKDTPQSKLAQISDALNMTMSWAQQRANIQQTQTQNKLLEEEILNKQSSRNLMDSQTFLNQLKQANTVEEKLMIVQQRLNAELEYLQNMHDYKINRGYHIRSNDQVHELFNTYKAIIGELKEGDSQTRETVQQILEKLNGIENFFNKRDYGKDNNPWGPEYDENGNRNLWYDYPGP